MHDFERIQWNRTNPAVRSEAHREEEAFLRFLTRWTPNEDIEVSGGFEYSFDKFGLDSPGYPRHDATATLYRQVGSMPRWSTRTLSSLLEHRWSLNSKWTSFIGTRIDKNTYSDALYSPRFTIVYAPRNKNTFKL